jgi:hypothetical protein
MTTDLFDPADPVDDEGRPQGPAPDSDHAHTLGQSVRRAGMGSIFDDPAQRPNRSSTAVKIARDRQLRDRDTAQARRLAVLAEDAEVYADDQARQRVREDLTRGRTPALADQVRAGRAVRRDPNTPRRSTAQQHAAAALARRQWQPTDR